MHLMMNLTFKYILWNILYNILYNSFQYLDIF